MAKNDGGEEERGYDVLFVLFGPFWKIQKKKLTLECFCADFQFFLNLFFFFSF